MADIDEYFEVPDKNGSIKIHYSIYGEGKPLVLVHGWLCNSRFWEDFIDLANEGYKVILPELRGHGQSDVAKNSSIERMAEDLFELLKYLGNDKDIILIGHSMGGIVAQALYHSHPEMFSALGLWNTGGRIPFGYGIGTLFYIIRIFSYVTGLILSYPIPPLFKVILTQGWKLSFKGWGKSPAYRKYVGDLKKMNHKAVLKAAFTLPSFNGLKKLKEINIPVMLLHGKADRYITPKQLAERMAKEIPNNTLYIVENAGHFPPNEQPDEVKSDLKEFLSKIQMN